MDATQICHQRAVNENPNVIVTGKLICNRIGTYSAAHMSPIFLNKAGRHMQSKVVIDRRIRGRVSVHERRPLIRVLSRLIKGEKLPVGGTSPGFHARIRIECK